MKTSERRIWIVGGLVVVAIVAGWYFYPSVLERLVTPPETKPGHGDAYGGLNTLFSGLAFAGLIVAIFLQREDLKAQREEMEAQRLEFAKSAEANKQAAEATERLTEAQRLAARVNALAARISGHDTQVVELVEHGSNKPMLERLRQERDTLLRRLDGILRTFGD